VCLHLPVNVVDVSCVEGMKCLPEGKLRGREEKRGMKKGKRR
jgi:hypothetical protein